MKRTLYFAIGLWLARMLFRPHSAAVVDPLPRLRNAGF